MGLMNVDGLGAAGQMVLVVMRLGANSAAAPVSVPEGWYVRVGMPPLSSTLCHVRFLKSKLVFALEVFVAFSALSSEAVLWRR